MAHFHMCAAVAVATAALLCGQTEAVERSCRARNGSHGSCLILGQCQSIAVIVRELTTPPCGLLHLFLSLKGPAERAGMNMQMRTQGRLKSAVVLLGTQQKTAAAFHKANISFSSVKNRGGNRKCDTEHTPNRDGNSNRTAKYMHNSGVITKKNWWWQKYGRIYHYLGRFLFY